MKRIKNFGKKISRLLKRRKKLFIVFLVIVLIVLGIRITTRKKQIFEKAEVEKGVVNEELVLSGEVKAVEHVELYFPASGKIIWVGVSEGQTVRKGQALAKLDTTSLNSTYQRALADLRSAEASLQKTHDDVKDHSSNESFAQKETRTLSEVAKDKAYEAVLIAEDNLKNATLVSPFAGIVTYVANPFSGINVLFSQKQIEIVNPETIYFEVNADQTEIGSLYNGQKVEIILDSLLDEELTGEVENISYTPQQGELGTVYKVKVVFKNLEIEKEKLRIGMTGDTKFILSSKEGVYYVPPQFVNSDQKGKYLLLNDKNKKEYIETGIENDNQIEITGNIKEGDIVFD